MPIVVISILNWNAALATLECLHAVLATIAPTAAIKVVILDNGSRTDDWQKLHEGCRGLQVQLIRQETNTGFAAGHNVVIRQALEENADYVWLLNNDAIVAPETLGQLLDLMQSNPHLGAVSPTIIARHDFNVVDFCGAIHDWHALDSVCARNPEHGLLLQQEHPDEFFIFGTAPLIRLVALRQIGLLDERFFAYYEDDDLCVRLGKQGWLCEVAFDTKIRHFRHKSYENDRPPYYFYLMSRNSILFYVKHTPSRQRQFLRTRLFARSMIKAALLEHKGHPEKANAVLIGTLHGLLNIGGPPRPDTPPPAWLKLICRIFPYRLRQWLG